MTNPTFHYKSSSYHLYLKLVDSLLIEFLIHNLISLHGYYTDKVIKLGINLTKRQSNII